MRPVEILLLLGNLLTFFLLVARLPSAVPWKRYLAATMLLIAITQVLVEGSRWQMVPAYVLASLFFLALLLKNSTSASQPAKQKRVYKVVFGLAICLGVLGLAASIALPIVLPVFHFPQPGGPYEIGTITCDWIDTSRREIFGTDPKAHRELMVQIWYPARKGSSSPRAPYIQDASAVATALARQHSFPDFSLEHLKYVTTHAVGSVPVADDKPSYPVLIYIEGLTGYRQMTTFQVEELVSHGYIVVGIDQPGAAASVVFPSGHQIAITGLVPQMQLLIHQSLSPAEKVPQMNGQVFRDGIIPYFAQDVSFTLDQLAYINKGVSKSILTGKLNLEHTGIFGMSLGGMVGAEASRKDARIKACLIEDVAMTADVVQRGLQQPSMWITRPAGMMRLERQNTGGWAEKDIVQTQATMRAVYNSLPEDGYFVQVAGMFHIDFTDLNLISPIFPTIGFSGPIGAPRSHDIINAYSIAFFGKYLNGTAEPLLNGPAKQFPEVIFEMHRHLSHP